MSSSNSIVVPSNANSNTGDSSKSNSRRKAPKTAISWNFPEIIPRTDTSAYPGAVTLSSPSLGNYGTALYAAYREIDDTIWITSSSDGKTWNGCYQLLVSTSSRIWKQALVSVSTIQRPSICAYSSYFYISWLNKSDNTIGFANTGDPTPPLNKLSSTWSPLTNVSVPTTPASGPSLASINGRLYLAYRDTNSNLYVASYGGTWNTFTAVKDSNNLNFVSADAPTLFTVASFDVLDDGLWISFRSVNKLYLGKAVFGTDGYTITGWTTSSVTLPCNIVDCPILGQFEDSLYLAFQASDGKICYACSTDGGSTWADWTTLSGNLIIGAPSMMKKGNTVLSMVFQAFSVDSSKRYLMSTYHDFYPSKK